MKHKKAKDDDVEKEGEMKNMPLSKRQSISEELGSSKRAKVDLSELERRAILKKQKVLWGRLFDFVILDRLGMRKLVDRCDF